MTIDVSDLGIKRLGSDGTVHSKVNYVSMNERLNKNAIERIKKVTSATDTSGRGNVAEIARQGFVIDSTPAYSIEFSSAGKVALKSFKQMKENWTKAEIPEKVMTEAVSSDDRLSGYSKLRDNARNRRYSSFGDMDRTAKADTAKNSSVKNSGQPEIRQTQSMKNALSAYGVQMNFKPVERKTLQYYGTGSNNKQK